MVTKYTQTNTNATTHERLAPISAPDQAVCRSRRNQHTDIREKTTGSGL
jgi:hypothetical protein